ncbi:hypothetical protein MTO96_029257, partial [Rhipicephalus appendiculatus]
MAAAMGPGTSLLVCLLIAQAAVVLCCDNDAAQTPSADGADSVLEAILDRTSYPRVTTPAGRKTSLRRNPLLRDFDSSTAETDIEVSTGYVYNSFSRGVKVSKPSKNCSAQVDLSPPLPPSSWRRLTILKKPIRTVHVDLPNVYVTYESFT